MARSVTNASARARRGFTLLESLMASGILLVIVLAVTSAITAGQQNAWEAQQRIAGALAAEDMLSRLVALPYEQLPNWHGHVEAPGAMTDVAGRPLPPSAAGVGRDVTVTTTLLPLGVENVVVRGRSIRVRCFDAADRTLAEITHFVPEPQ